MRVVKEVFQDTDELVFEGSDEDCKKVLETLNEYHKYDHHISIVIPYEQYPRFDSIEDFFEIYEYKATYEMLKD